MNDNSGHRKRLRDRFLKLGREAVCDHELLELLLFYAIPRRDVKPIAKALLKRFGSLQNVIAATDEQLIHTKGIGTNSAALIKLIFTIAVKITEAPLRIDCCLNKSDKIREYLMLNFRRSNREFMQLLLLDQQCCLLDTLTIDGNMKHVDLSDGELLLKVLSCRGTRQVIIAHNHLNNVTSSSQADIKSTIRLKKLLGDVGISLLDHYVVTADECVSIMKLP